MAAKPPPIEVDLAPVRDRLQEAELLRQQADQLNERATALYLECVTWFQAQHEGAQWAIGIMDGKPYWSHARKDMHLVKAKLR